MTTNFFHSSLLFLFLDPGSEIRDPGWVKIRIRDKHPGSATQAISIYKDKTLRIQIVEAQKLPDPTVLEHGFQAKKNIKNHGQSQEIVQYRPGIDHKKVVLTTQ
jgi:hypothetical protein